MRFTYDDTEDRLNDRSPSRIAFDDRRPATVIHAAMNDELKSFEGPASCTKELFKANVTAYESFSEQLKGKYGRQQAGSWNEEVAEAARIAQERGSSTDRMVGGLRREAASLRETDPQMADYTAKQADHLEARFERDTWASIAAKEFVMRGASDSFEDYRKEHALATEKVEGIETQLTDMHRALRERGSIQPAASSDTATVPAGAGGQDQRPGFQRRQENSRLDRPDPDKPASPAAAMPVPEKPARDAIAPQDREQWLRQHGATNEMFLKNAMKDDQTFEKVRTMMEAQGGQQSREPSRETVARLDARATAQAAQPQQAQDEEARNRPRMR